MPIDFVHPAPRHELINGVPTVAKTTRDAGLLGEVRARQIWFVRTIVAVVFARKPLREEEKNIVLKQAENSVILPLN